MYDIIGDIHGYASELKQLLGKLGYREHEAVWQHPERKLVFLGDLVDRGPRQVETVEIVRGIVENGHGLAVMGNHEFNAVTWAMPDSKRPGSWLREHSQRNREQHQSFLKQVGEGSEQHRRILDWFKTLPLFLELEGFRLIHACWHPGHLQTIQPCLDQHNRIREEAWPALTEKNSQTFEALEVLLKGLEIQLPSGVEILDKSGYPRTGMRTEWWNLEGVTYRDLAMVPASEIEKIPHEPIPEDILPGYDAAKPVFVGHYWMEGIPRPLNDHIACLDYSIAGRGSNRKLCAYRWDGERILSQDNFVWIAPGAEKTRKPHSR